MPRLIINNAKIQIGDGKIRRAPTVSIFQYSVDKNYKIHVEGQVKCHSGHQYSLAIIPSDNVMYSADCIYEGKGWFAVIT